MGRFFFEIAYFPGNIQACFTWASLRILFISFASTAEEMKQTAKLATTFPLKS